MMKKLLVIIALLMLVAGCSISHSKKEYYCEQGIIQGEMCRIDETSEVVLGCKSGEELVDNKCRLETMSIPASVGDRSCAKGYSFYETMCISDEGQDKVASITCPEPENENETIQEGQLACFKTTCLKKDESGKCIQDEQVEIEGEIEYSCPSGTKFVYWKCRKAYYPFVEYSCPTGELDGKRCVFYETHDPELICPVDFTLNEEKNICEKTYYVEAFAK